MNISDNKTPTVQKAREEANIQVKVHHTPDPERLETGEKARKMTSDFSTADQEMIKESVDTLHQGRENQTTKSIHYGNGKYTPITPNRGESVSEIVGFDPNKENYEKSVAVKDYSETVQQLGGSRSDIGPHNQIGPEIDAATNPEGYVYNLKKDQQRTAEKEKHPYLKAHSQQFQDNSPQLTSQNNPEALIGDKKSKDDKPNVVGSVNETFIKKDSDESKEERGKADKYSSEKTGQSNKSDDKTSNQSSGDSKSLETTEKRIKEEYSDKIKNNPELKTELKERANIALDNLEKKKDEQKSEESSLNKSESKTKAKVSDLKDQVANKISNAKDVVQDKAKDIKDSTKQTYVQVKKSDTVQKLGQKADEIKENVSKKADNIQKDLEQSVQKSVDTKNQDTTEKTLHKAEEGIINLAHKAEDKLEKAKESEPTHKLKDALIATTSLLSGAYEAVRHKVADMVHHEPESSTSKTDEQIKADLNDKYDNMKQNANELKEAVKDSATDTGISSKDHSNRESETISPEKPSLRRSDSLGEYDQFKFIWLIAVLFETL